jgi:hypothetical protein
VSNLRTVEEAMDDAVRHALLDGVMTRMDTEHGPHRWKLRALDALYPNVERREQFERAAAEWAVSSKEPK